ncbi:MAG TPA: DNA adenine methylase [Candidatus Kryptonia bacterium]
MKVSEKSLPRGIPLPLVPEGLPKTAVLDENIRLADFPSTRYQGSKRKMLAWIWENLREIPFKTALDGFGGTASVSYLLKKMAKRVTYNDKLRFNYLIGRALIENSRIKLTMEDVEWLLAEHDDVAYSNFVVDNFKGKYFRDSENQWLDKVNSNLMQFKMLLPGPDQYKVDLAYYALFQASLMKRPFNLFHRENLSIRTRRVKRTFGNKKTWETPFDDLFRRFALEANKLVIDNDVSCSAVNYSIFDINPEEFDLVYLDPPYLRLKGGNETSNYFKCYHFLEGMSNYSSWSDVLNRFQEDGKSDFGLDDIHLTFERMLERFKGSKIVLSYKKSGAPSIEYICRLLKKLGKKVYTRSIHYSYALNHQNGDAKKNREYLIFGI